MPISSYGPFREVQPDMGHASSVFRSMVLNSMTKMEQDRNKNYPATFA